VTFFSSAGIAALAAARAAALDKDLILQVVTPTESFTYRTLQLSGMAALLTIHPSLAAALATHQADAGGLSCTDPTTGDDEDPHDSTPHLTPAG
jgi:hypothetical protein